MKSVVIVGIILAILIIAKKVRSSPSAALGGYLGTVGSGLKNSSGWALKKMEVLLESFKLSEDMASLIQRTCWMIAGFFFALFIGWYFWREGALELYTTGAFLMTLFCFGTIALLWSRGGWGQFFSLVSIAVIVVGLLTRTDNSVWPWMKSWTDTSAKAGEAIPPTQPSPASNQLNELKRKTMSLLRSDYARPSNVNEFIWPADPKRECGFIQTLTPPHRSHMRRVYLEIQGSWPLCATGRMEGVVVEAVGMASKGCVTISYQEHNDPPEKNRFQHVCAGQEWSPKNVSWYRFVNGDRNNNIVIYFDYDRKS